MIAEIAGELVSKFIERSWPSDRKDIYEILRIGLNKAWSEGRWLGMSKEFFVNVYKDESGQNYFMGPQSHPILLAVNVLGKPATVRDSYFMFHKNGYGDIRDTPGCSWNQDIYDIGSLPYFNKNNINFSTGVQIGVRPLGAPGPNESVYVSGSYGNGNRIYTYKNAQYGNCCACEAKTDEVDGINGIELKLKPNEFTYICNIQFTDILSITKSITRTPVEVIAIDAVGNGHLIARLEPNQRFSSYRKYLVPNDLCNVNCLHAIFKIAQQEKIASGTDNIIISNEEALISLAKCVQYIYYKEQLEVGANYFLQAITCLEKEKREEESQSSSPIQVEGIYNDDLPEALKRYA